MLQAALQGSAHHLPSSCSDKLMSSLVKMALMPSTLPVVLNAQQLQACKLVCIRLHFAWITSQGAQNGKPNEQGSSLITLRCIWQGRRHKGITKAKASSPATLSLVLDRRHCIVGAPVHSLWQNPITVSQNGHSEMS